MALYIYNRCSTNGQDFIQQMNTIHGYLKAHGINIKRDIKDTITEHITGTGKFTERKLAELLGKCVKGDTIYFSELSRLGRNMNDLNIVVTGCCERGIKLVQCKDGMEIENESIGGKALLFALSLAAEIEVANIRQRTQSALDARKQMLQENGHFISKSGEICTHLGRSKGCDLTTAQDAARRAHNDSRMKWFAESKAFQWVKAQVLKNKRRSTIIEEFNELHAQQPDVYCTRDGKPLSAPILSRWIRMIPAV